MSLLTSFAVGVTGIHSAQTSINTASHNLANAQTPGYSRQQEVITDLTYNTLGLDGRNSLKQVGLGSKVQMTRQIRDIFLDKQYRLEVGRQSFYQVQYETAVEIQDLFGEMEGVEFVDKIEEYWKVCQELQKYPESIVNRELFISASEAFLEAAQTLSQTLNAYQTNLNARIQKQVNRINEIGEEIKALNLQIARSEISTEQANDYRDARNLLMDELGELTYFTYEEDTNGTMSIWIENAPLVSGGLSFHMGTERMEEAIKGTDETTLNNLYNVVWLDNGCGDVYDMSRPYSYESKTDVGSLRGILTVRGAFVADYTDMPVKPEMADYTDDAGVLDEDAYNKAVTAYEKEVEAYNNGTGASLITKIQSQFDLLIHGIVTTVNDILCPNIEVELTVEYKAQNGETIEAGKYKMLDLYKCPVGADDNATVGEELFCRGSVPRYTIIDVPDGYDFPATDENGNPLLDEDGHQKTIKVYQLYVYNEEEISDPSTLYSVSELKMNQKVLQNYSYLEVQMNPNTGNPGAAYDREAFTKLLNAWDKEFAVLDPNTLTSYNFVNYYKEMIGDLGTQGMVWESMLDRCITETESTEDKRQQVMGVSAEEELTELIKFQYCYKAASRYITVIDEMLNNLITQLG